MIKDYMVIWYWGMIFLVVPMVGNNIIRATGDTFTVYGPSENIELINPLLNSRSNSAAGSGSINTNDAKASTF